jgi:hypothetical protein
MKPPSPETLTTRCSGRARHAAIAPGRPMPIVAKPLLMMTVFGSYAGNRRPSHSLCAPTSETRTSSGAIASRIATIAACGLTIPGRSARARSSVSTDTRRRVANAGSSPAGSSSRKASRASPIVATTSTSGM